MATRQYIGARYVIKVYENSLNPASSDWEASVNYEPLTLVTFNYGSYLSKKVVPASVGNPADNPSYWTQTGFYNGQIAQLQEYDDRLDKQFPSIYGKNVAVYGDSWVANPNFNKWIDVLRAATGTTVNTAYGGYLDNTDSNCVSNAITNYPFVADIYIIHGGINDWNKSRGIADTAAGIVDIISKLRTLNSDCEIYFITPVSKVFIPNDYNDTVYFPCDLYRQVIWTICANHNAAVIDGLKFPIAITSDGFHPDSDEDMEYFGKGVLRAIINKGDSRSFENQYRMTLDPNTGNRTMYIMKGGRLYVQPFASTIAYVNGVFVMELLGYAKLGSVNIPPATGYVENVGGTLYYGFNRIVGNNMQAQINDNTVNGNGLVAQSLYQLELLPTAIQHGII